MLEKHSQQLTNRLGLQANTAKATNPNANVSAQETKINHLIAELFNLADEEIAIVEGNG